MNAELNATVRLVHATVLTALNDESDDAMCEPFERWDEAGYPMTMREYFHAKHPGAMPPLLETTRP